MIQRNDQAKDRPADQPSGISRREMFGIAGAGVAAGMWPMAQSAVAQNNSTPMRAGRRGKAKNVILLVSDGMSTDVVRLAEMLSQQTRNKSTAWYPLMQRDDAVHGHLASEPATGFVTDSAAAASAWGSGHQVNNGVLNITPAGKKCTPIHHPLKKAGIATGLVTTDEMPGATAAGFCAVQENRRAYDAIARQYLGTTDVLLGGGRNYFDAKVREDGRNVIDEYQQAGYAWHDNRKALRAAAASPRTLGLFHPRKLPYTIDHMADATLRADVPTLAEMTDHAIQCLNMNDKGFFLMVEGARVDHAAHINDIATILNDQLAFDDAVQQALDFAQADGETLVIVTTDHGNSNPGLSYGGEPLGSSKHAFPTIANFNASFPVMARKIIDLAKTQNPATAARRVFAQHAQLELTDKQAELIAQAALHPDQVELLASHYFDPNRNWAGQWAQVLSHHTMIGFCSMHHTNESVLLSALGPHAEMFTGLRHHVQLHRNLCEIFNIRPTGQYVEQASPHATRASAAL